MARDKQASDKLARIERALASMPNTMRQIFLAHRLDDLGYPEIAQRLGISVAQVERHIANAMRHLVRALDGADRDPD
jgi:RNA polymerase sigma-70 factor (ECF subfamily)